MSIKAEETKRNETNSNEMKSKSTSKTSKDDDCEICFTGSCNVSCQKCNKSFCQTCLVNFHQSGEGTGTMKCVYCLQIIPFRQLCDIFRSEKLASTYFYTKENIDQMIRQDQVLLAKAKKFIDYDQYKKHTSESIIRNKEQVSLHNSTANSRSLSINSKTTYFQNYDNSNGSNGSSSSSRSSSSRSSTIQVVDMICPGTNCFGLVSFIEGEDRRCCNVCKISICAKCNEQKQNDQHVCNPDILKNREFVSSQLYPCPKCGVSIEKSEGCSSVYCTFCGHKFMYGYTIEKQGTQDGVLHDNFHYIEQQQVHGQQQLEKIAFILANRNALSNREIESLNTCRIHEFTSNKIELSDLLESIGLDHLVTRHYKRQKTIFKYEWIDKIHLLFNYDEPVNWKEIDQLFGSFFHHRERNEKVKFLKILHFLYELPDCVRTIRSQKYTGKVFDTTFQNKKNQIRKKFLMKKISRDAYGKALLKCQYEEQKELIYGSLLDLLLLNLHIIQDEFYQHLHSSQTSGTTTSGVLQRIQNLLVLFNDMFQSNFRLHSVNVNETEWTLKTTEDTYETSFFL